MRRRTVYLDSLSPTTDLQRLALAAAQATVQTIAQSQIAMAFALSNPVSLPLIFTVLAWASVLFCGFGLTSRANPASFVALACGATAVASAAYLILALSSPYSGAIRASPAPLEQVLAYVGQGQGTVGASR